MSNSVLVTWKSFACYMKFRFFTLFGLRWTIITVHCMKYKVTWREFFTAMVHGTGEVVLKWNSLLRKNIFLIEIFTEIPYFIEIIITISEAGGSGLGLSIWSLGGITQVPYHYLIVYSGMRAHIPGVIFCQTLPNL